MSHTLSISNLSPPPNICDFIFSILSYGSDCNQGHAHSKQVFYHGVTSPKAFFCFCFSCVPCPPLSQDYHLLSVSIPWMENIFSSTFSFPRPSSLQYSKKFLTKFGSYYSWCSKPAVPEDVSHSQSIFLACSGHEYVSSIIERLLLVLMLAFVCGNRVIYH